MELAVNGHALGVGTSEIALAAPGRVTLTARVGCLLAERSPDAPPDASRVPGPGRPSMRGGGAAARWTSRSS